MLTPEKEKKETDKMGIFSNKPKPRKPAGERFDEFKAGIIREIESEIRRITGGMDTLTLSAATLKEMKASDDWNRIECEMIEDNPDGTATCLWMGVYRLYTRRRKLHAESCVFGPPDGEGYREILYTGRDDVLEELPTRALTEIADTLAEMEPIGREYWFSSYQIEEFRVPWNTSEIRRYPLFDIGVKDNDGQPHFVTLATKGFKEFVEKCKEVGEKQAPYYESFVKGYIDYPDEFRLDEKRKVLDLAIPILKKFTFHVNEEEIIRRRMEEDARES